jgi:hypothetical protein
MTLITGSRPPSAPWESSVALRDQEGITPVRKFGRNKNVAASPTIADAWSRGGVWQPPTAPRIHTITSTSDDDAVGGSGLHSASIFGILTNWRSVVIPVPMNGQAGTVMTTPLRDIYRMSGGPGGAGGRNVGEILATAAAPDNTVTAAIPVRAGQTQQAIYTVEIGATALIKYYYATLNRDGGGGGQANVNVALLTRENLDQPFPDVWRERVMLGLQRDGNSFFFLEFPEPIPVIGPARVKIELRDASVSDNDVSCGFGLEKIQDNPKFVWE